VTTGDLRASVGESTVCELTLQLRAFSVASKVLLRKDARVRSRHVRFASLKVIFFWDVMLCNANALPRKLWKGLETSK